MIGWREVDNHIQAMETAVFQDNLAPIAKYFNGPLNVVHYQFKEI
jgi:hypothetical protein